MILSQLLNTMFKIREDFRPAAEIKEWMWIESDDGMFDGPFHDWYGHHKENILKYVEKKRVVVQAGGGCGMYPVLLSQYFNTVYTFEPDWESFYCLVYNCGDKKGIVKMQAALSREHMMVGLNRNSTSNYGAHTIAEGGELFIPALKIDDLDLQHCDLIMLDVEQYEGNVLIGARQTIKKHKPILMMEGASRYEVELHKMGYEYICSSASDALYKPINTEK